MQRIAIICAALLAAAPAAAVNVSFVNQPDSATITAGNQSDQLMSANTTASWTVQRMLRSRDGFCSVSTTLTNPLGIHFTSTQATTTTLRWRGPLTDAGSGVNYCFRIRACPVPFNPLVDTCASRTVSYNVVDDGAEAIRLPHRYTAIEANGQPTRILFEPTNAFISPTSNAGDLLSVLSCPAGATDCNGALLPPWVQFVSDNFGLYFDVEPPFGAAGDWAFTMSSGGATQTLHLRVLDTEFVHIDKKPQAYGIPGSPYLELDRHHVEDEANNDNPATAPYFDRGYMSGEIDPIGDQDHFAFHTGGEEYHQFTVSDRLGTGCNFDPRLSVHELLPDGTLGPALVEDDASGPGNCPQTQRVLYEAGKTFIVRISEDGNDAIGPRYFIEHDYWVEDAEESLAADAELYLQPGVFGSANGFDSDFGRITTDPSDTVDFEVSDGAGGCAADFRLRVFEDNGFGDLTLIAEDDTSGIGSCPKLTGVPGGFLVVQVSRDGISTVPAPYFLDINRTIVSEASDVPSWLSVGGWNEQRQTQQGTCGAAFAVYLDDLSNNGDYYGAYDADIVNPTCSTDPDAEVRPDGQSICRERGEPYAHNNAGWTVAATRYGTRLGTVASNPGERMVVAHAAGRSPLLTEADGTHSGGITVFDVDPGTVGNDFYYDPWGECDEQSYPNASVCKIPIAGLEPPVGQSPSCTISRVYREGTRAVFEMTRWNQSTTVSVTRCSSFDDTSCLLTVPQGVTYDQATDEFIWDIPYTATTRTSTFIFRLRAAGANVSPADYYFSIRVSNRTNSGVGADVLLRDIRERKPLAFVDEDVRLVKSGFRAFDFLSDQNVRSRHDGNDVNFVYATNTFRGRSIPVGGRVSLHPAFAHGRIGDPKGDSTFQMIFKNEGSASSTSRTGLVYLKPAFADEAGGLTASAPTATDTPFATFSIPALGAGATVERTFNISPAEALPSAGYEPYTAGVRALFIDMSGTDVDPGNDLAGPFFLGPAPRPPTRIGCLAGLFDQPGFAGTFCAADDVTGVMVVDPEDPEEGDTVTVNVQAQFVGTGWSSSSVVRFYHDQSAAPTASTPNDGQRSFPSSPTEGLLYGYTFTFTAEKPANSTNTIPLRAFLDATNAVTEDGDGESNNQLPSVGSPYQLEVVNTPPSFATAAVTSATEDSTYSYEVKISDANTVDFANLTLTVDGPAGMAFTGAIATCASESDKKCRTLQWVPDDADAVVGTHAVTLTACDGDPVAGGAGDCTDQAFVINVTRVNDPPEILTSSFDTTATEDATYTQTISIFDEEGDAVSFSLPTKPAGMTISPLSATAALISWTPDDNGVGSKAVTARVFETGTPSNLDEASWVINVSNVNDAPTLGAPAETVGDTDGDASALTGAEGEAYAARLAIGDVDNSLAGQGQSHTCAKLSPTPAWISVGKSGNFCVVTGTPANADTGVRSVRVQVTDNGSPNLSATRTYSLTVSDIVNDTPAFAAVAPQVMDQNDTLSLDISVTDDDFNSPGFSEDLTFSQTLGPSSSVLTDNGTSVNFEWTPGPDDVGATSVTLRVEDSRGAVDTVSFNITVNNVNDAPVLSDPADATKTEGETYSATLIADDDDLAHGDSLTFSVVSGAPTGFTLNSTTGAMSLDPIDDAQVGVHDITVRVTDASDATDEQTFRLTITNVEEAPVFAAIADQSTDEDASFSLFASAPDPDAGATVTYSLTTSPTGMSIDASTGEITWVPDDGDVGDHTVTVLATDNTARTDSETFVLTVDNTNDAPSISSTAVTAATEESTYSYVVSATDDDLDSGDALTFSATTKPAWLSFNAVTRTLSGTPDDAEVGSHSVVLRVEDESGAFDTQSFSVIVAPVNDPPVLTSVGGVATGGSPIAFAVDEGDTLALTVVGSDVDDVLGLTYDFSIILDTVTAASINATTGAFSFTPTFDEAGEYSFEFSITDPSGAFDTEIVTITVNDVNRAPTFDSSPVTAVDEDAAYSYDVDATDPDGDTVTYSLPTRPSGMTINATTGVIAWTPVNAQVGAHSVVVRATDEHGLPADQSFTVTVTNTNDAPIFTSTPITTGVEETAYSYTATADDDDGDSLTFSATTLPTWMSFNPSTRVLSGTPDDGDEGANPVVLQADDGNGGVTTQSFTVTVTAVNDAPAFVAPTPAGPTLAAAEGAELTFTLAADDPDGPALTYSITGQPAGSTLNPTTGAFAWTPGFDQAGTFNVTLRASDGSLVDTRALSIIVSNTDRAPTVSAPATAATDEGVAVGFTVTGNDADGDTVTLSLESGPAGVSFNAGTGAFSWTPGFDQDGDHDVVFRASANGLFSETTTTITVTHVNQAPSLGAPSATAATQDLAFSATLDATDVDLGTAPIPEVLSFSKVAGPAALAVSKLDADTAQVDWTPSAADVGDHLVTVRVTDGDGETDDRSFTVSVANVNDPPVVTSTAVTAATQGVLYSYTFTFSDADAGLGDVITLSAPTLPAWLGFNPSSGVLSGTPDNDDALVGAHSVTLRAQDAGGLFAEQSFVITVANVNDAPAIDPVGNKAVLENVNLNFTVTARDIDGTVPGLSITGLPTGATFSTTTVGSTEVGTFDWTPGNDDAGVFSVTFTADDGVLTGSETISISVGNVNQPPEIATVGNKTVAEGASLAFTVTASDGDGDTVTLSAAGGANDPFTRGATFTPATGAFSWTPGFADAGVYTVNFSASDGNGGADSELITITVTNTNRAPAFDTPPTPDAPLSGAEDSALSFTAQATDPDGDGVTYSLAPLPSGASFDAGTGVFSWTPGFNQAGTFNLTLTATDGSDPATRAISLVIANTDRPPTVTAPATRTVAEGSELSFAVTGADPDGDGVSLSLVSGPSGSTFDGATFRWTPGFADQGPHTATFRATAGGLTADATTNITVTNVNQPPSLGPPSATTATQDLAFSATLTAADADLGTGVGETLSFTKIAGPANLVVTKTGPTEATLSWTPGALEVSPAVQGVTLRVTDASGASADRVFNLNVINVNDAPTLANPGNGAVSEGATFSQTLSASDLDIDAGLTDTLTFSLTVAPTGMSVNASTGTITWATGDGDPGVHNVTARVTDAADAFDEVSFTVTVTNVPDDPFFTSTPITAATQDVGYIYTATADDADLPFGDSLTLSATTLPSWLGFDPGTGALTGTPANDDVGSHPVSLRAEDGAGAFAVQSFTIVVANVNDAPVLDPVAPQAVAEGASLSFNVTASDPDGDGVTITLSSADLPPAATFDGTTFSWATTFDDEGSYTATFTASDGSLSAQIDVAITVGAINRAPVLDPIGARSVDEGVALSITPSATDPDGDTVSFTATGGANDPFTRGATFSGGVFSWTPGFDDAGAWQVTFTASDGALSDAEQVTITVSDVNRAPVFAASPPSATDEDAAFAYTAAATDADGDTLGYSLTVGPGAMNIDPDTGALSWVPTNADVGDHPINVRVDDGRGGVADQSFTLTVNNVNDAPVITSTAITSVAEGGAYAYTFAASDVDAGDLLTLSATALPTWMSFDPGSGALSGAPDDAEVGTHPVTLRVTDLAGAFAEQSFNVIVTPVNDVPVFVDPTPSGTLTVAEDELLTFTAAATDPDGPSAIVYTAQGLPSGATLDPSTGAFSWRPSFNDAGSRALTLVADDGLATVTRALTLVVTNTDRAPVLTAPATATGAEGAQLSFTVSGDDPDGDPVTLAMTAGPTGATFDAGTGQFRWTPSFDEAGPHSASFEATSGGLTDAATVNITITDTNRPPSVSSTPPGTATEDAPYAYSVVAEDADGDPTTLLLVSGPANATLTGADLSWTPTGAQVGTRSFLIRVSDGRGGVFDHAFDVVVSPVNDLPIITSAPVLAATEDLQYSYDVDASDEEGEALTFTLPTAPASMNIDADTGVITWIPTNADVGDHPVTVRVADPQGGQVEQSFTVSVANVNDPPVILAAPAPPATVAEEALFSWTPAVTDVDAGDSVSLSLVFGPSGMAFNGGALEWTPANEDVGIHAVRVRATDLAGASVIRDFDVEVFNLNDAPFFVSAPIDATVNEEGVLVQTVLADDVDAGDTLIFTLIGAPAQMSIDAASGQLVFTPDDAEVGEHNFTVRVEDLAGDFVEQSARVIVNPVNDRPVLDPIANQQVDAGVELVVALNAVDPDGPSLTFALDAGPAGVTVVGSTLRWTPTVDQAGVHDLTVSVTDGTESDTETFTVVVGQGDLPPTLTIPADRTIDEAEQITVLITAVNPPGQEADPITLGATNLPSGAQFEPGPGAFTWAPTFDDAGVYAITFTATNSAGTSTRVWNLTVRDVNRSPFLTTGSLPNAVEGTLYAEIFEATDLDGDDLTFSLVSGPGDMSIDAVTGQLDFTPVFADVGLRAVRVRVQDGRGGIDERDFDLFVEALDVDGDGLPDTWEVLNGTDPTRDDADEDPDGDGLTNLEEFQQGKDPFVSNAPTAPLLIAPVAGERVRTARPELVFTEATDPDGDPLTYVVRVALASDPNVDVFFAAGLAGAGGEVRVTVDLDLTEGAVYVWQAFASDGQGLSAGGEVRTFTVDAVNEPPPAPVVIAPVDGSSVATSTPTLRVSPVVDPDGDAVTYVFTLRQSAGGPVEIQSSAVVASGAEVVFAVDELLPDQSVWFWEVTPTDARGLAGTPSTQARFTVDLTNLPPPDPTILSPADGEVVTANPVALVVSQVLDPEGLAVTYSYELSTDPTFPVNLTQFFQEDTPVNGEVSAAVGELADDDYFWRVIATDGATFTNPVTAAFTVDAVDDPPPAPTLLAPADNSLVTTAAVTLVAETVEDPDGTELSYRFELTNAAGDTLIDAVEGVEDLDADGEVTADFAGLTAGQVYGWRARADEPDGVSSEYSELFTFRVELVNERPAAPVLLAPADGALVTEARPELSWEAAVDPDGDAVVHDVELLDADGDLLARVEDLTDVAGVVRFTPTNPLPEGTVTWRARGRDAAGGGPFAERTFEVELPVVPDAGPPPDDAGAPPDDAGAPPGDAGPAPADGGPDGPDGPNDRVVVDMDGPAPRLPSGCACDLDGPGDPAGFALYGFGALALLAWRRRKKR